jgi:transposase-like protein
MRPKRKFEREFRRQVVEELLAKISTPAQIVRKYGISSGLLQNWKQQYAKGKYGNEPEEVEGLKERVRELERKLGQMTMDNDILKSACQNLVKSPKKAKIYSVGKFDYGTTRRSQAVVPNDRFKQQQLLL